jgi:hypothetical protein
MSLYLDKAKNRYQIEFTRVMPDGERVRKTKLLATGLTHEQATALHDKMETDLFVRTRLTVMTDGWDEYVDAMLADKASWLHKMVARPKSHEAKKR